MSEVDDYVFSSDESDFADDRPRMSLFDVISVVGSLILIHSLMVIVLVLGEGRRPIEDALSNRQVFALVAFALVVPILLLPILHSVIGVVQHSASRLGPVHSLVVHDWSYLRSRADDGLERRFGFRYSVFRAQFDGVYDDREREELRRKAVEHERDSLRFAALLVAPLPLILPFVVIGPGLTWKACLFAGMTAWLLAGISAVEARRSAERYWSALTAAVVLHRFDVLSRLHLQLPDNLATERVRWSQARRLTVDLNEPPIDFVRDELRQLWRYEAANRAFSTVEDFTSFMIQTRDPGDILRLAHFSRMGDAERVEELLTSERTPDIEFEHEALAGSATAPAIAFVNSPPVQQPIEYNGFVSARWRERDGGREGRVLSVTISGDPAKNAKWSTPLNVQGRPAPHAEFRIVPDSDFYIVEPSELLIKVSTSGAPVERTFTVRPRPNAPVDVQLWLQVLADRRLVQNLEINSPGDQSDG